MIKNFLLIMRWIVFFVSFLFLILRILLDKTYNPKYLAVDYLDYLNFSSNYVYNYKDYFEKKILNNVNAISFKTLSLKELKNYNIVDVVSLNELKINPKFWITTLDSNSFKTNLNPDINKTFIYTNDLDYLNIVYSILANIFPNKVSKVGNVIKVDVDYDYVAKRILGIRFYLIILPFLVIGLFFSLVSFFLNETIVPLSMSASEKIVKEKIIKAPLAFLQTNVFFKLPDGKIIIIKEIDKQKGEMNYITLIDNNTGFYPRIITASKGVAKDFKIILYNGFITDISYKGFIKSQAKFEKLIIPLDISVDKITEELKTPWEMKYSELKEKVNEIEKIGLKDNYLKTQLYLKFSLPLSNIILILLSLPLAVMFARKGRFIGLFLSVFLIFFYYSSFSFFVALGKNNILNPFLAAFLANFIMLFAGIILIYILEK